MISVPGGEFVIELRRNAASSLTVGHFRTAAWVNKWKLAFDLARPPDCPVAAVIVDIPAGKEHSSEYDCDIDPNDESGHPYEVLDQLPQLLAWKREAKRWQPHGSFRNHVAAIILAARMCSG